MKRRSLEYSAQARAGMVAYWLSRGERLTVAQIAAKLEMTEHGAWCMMHKLEEVLPIENREGKWGTFVIA